MIKDIIICILGIGLGVFMEDRFEQMLLDHKWIRYYRKQQKRSIKDA